MPKTKKNLSKVSQLRMTEEMYTKLEQMALDDDRPIASMVRVLLDEAIYYRGIGMSKRMASRFMENIGIGDQDRR